MVQAPRTNLNRARPPYLDSQAGWRVFVISLLLAAILGLGFRLYFSPPRLKTWALAAIEAQKKKSSDHPFAVSFDRVDVSLARGWVPEFAVVLNNVKVAPRSDCRPEASVFAGKLRLPLRLRSLALGRVVVGVVSAEDLVVDLDGLRSPCEAQAVSRAEESKGPQEKPKAEKQNEGEGEEISGASHEPAKPWWTHEQYDAARANVEGIEFSRATLQFENRTKEVYLDSFEALVKSDDRVSISTEMRIPPSVAYGETIPPLRVDGDATSSKADLSIMLRVSEGSLTTKAEFTPAENQTLNLAANLSIKSLPLSMITPLMRKSGLVNEKFNPRFLWLDCGASISGAFQGLFQNHPLTLNHCQIEGDGADLRLETASREPSGAWSPFTVDIVSLEVAKLLSTIGASGLESLLAKEGRLEGRLEYLHADDATISGTIRNIDFIFSNQSVRTLQRIDSVEVQAKLLNNHLTIDLDQASLRDGVLDGKLSAVFEKPFKSGTVDLAIKKLSLDPAVQNVLVDGRIGEMTATAKAEWAESRIKRLTSYVHIGETQGKEIRFDSLDVKADQARESLPHITFASPLVEVQRASPIFQGLRPAFLNHEFRDEWVPIKKLRGNIAVLDEETTHAVFEWTSLSGTMEDGQIQISSAGRLGRDRRITGSLGVDFPAAKKLAWQLGGTLNAPLLSAPNEGVKKFKSRVDNDDAALGLKQK